MPDKLQKIRLRVSHGGVIAPDPDRPGQYIYKGGQTYLESVPASTGYAEFIFRLSEKTSSGVSVKYLLPGEALRADNLITIADNADLQEMFEEYERGLRIPGTPIRTFRLRVLLFGVVEVPYSLGEPMTPEELADAHSFFNVQQASGRGSSSKLVFNTGMGQSGLSSALSSSGTPQSHTPGRMPTPPSPAPSPARVLLASPMPEPPDEDLATWQAGFIAGQEAAAFVAQLPPGSLDHDSSGVLLSPKSRQSDTPKGSGSAKMERSTALSPPLDQQPPKRCWPDAGLCPLKLPIAWDYIGTPKAITPHNDKPHRASHCDGSSLLELLPSNISAFGGCISEPPEPAVPPVSDYVTSGVCLPSHISAFGDMSTSETNHPPPQMQSFSGSHHPEPGQFQTAADRLLQTNPYGGVFIEEVTKDPVLKDEMQGVGWLRNASPKALLAARVHCVPQSEIVLGDRIGGGAFGDVYRAMSPTFGEVAVKWLKQDQGRHGAMLQVQSFGAEAEVLSSVNHPNVLRFYGVVTCSERDPTIMGIMTEYIRGGSLSDLCRQQIHKREYLPLRLRAEIALGAVKGLAYLHQMRIVHFDLKPDNLLLDATSEGFTVKVADFGLHKHKRAEDSFVSDIRDLRGTLPYMAPELVNDSKHVSEKADVWSLGMVLFEMLVLKVPFSDLKPQEIVKALMTAGQPSNTLLPKVPVWCEPEWASIIESCWEVAPAARPPLRDIASQLETICQSCV